MTDAADLAAMLPEDPTTDAPWQRAARGVLTELVELRRQPKVTYLPSEPIPDGGA